LNTSKVKVLRRPIESTLFVRVDVDQRGVDVDDQWISPSRLGGGVEVVECVPGAAADGAHRPGHLVIDAVGVVGELVDSAVGGGHGADGPGQTRSHQRLQQVQVIQAGGTGGQRDGQGCQHRAGSVGDSVRGQAGE